MSTNGIPPKPQHPIAAKHTAPPNQTLYISNLNEKVSKPDIKRALYTLFSTHGHILDIVALKTLKMRGQAHVVFKDVQSSTQAMQALQGFGFLGKELRISYGKGRSDIISKLDGSVKGPEPSKPGPPANGQPKPPNSLPPSGVVARPAPPTIGSLRAPNAPASDGSKSPQGTKRPRQEESDEDEAMQDEDDGEAMEVSDED